MQDEFAWQASSGSSQTREPEVHSRLRNWDRHLGYRNGFVLSKISQENMLKFLAETYPNCKVIGSDLSPIQPELYNPQRHFAIPYL